MASVNTNVAAITALRTLQQTNTSLDATQNRISTGLKIGEAKDNAAYWSISTTLKSDNKSLSTVKDALGLGGATVDVAYQGLNKAKDVLDEIKSKLTAASQPGVDKTKIQAEIGELQKQLVSIASSSTFSGENWLSVDSSIIGYGDTKSIVASFTRNANGSVSIGTIGVNIDTVSLYNASASADGILDTKTALVDGNNTALAYGGTAPSGASGNTSKNSLEAKSVVAGAATISQTTTGTSATTLDATNYVTFDLTVDGVKRQIKLDNTTNTGNVSTRDNLKTALDAAITAAFTGGAPVPVTATVSTTGISFASPTGGSGSNIKLDNIQVTGTVVGGSALFASASGTQAAATTTMTDDVASTTLDADDSITFNIAVDGASAKTVRIDKALVNKTLNITTGVIADITAMKAVTTAALTAAGVTGVTVGNATNKLTLTSNTTTGASQISVSNVVASQAASVMSVDKIDITKLEALGAITGDQQRAVLEAYVSVVNAAINKVTSAAANLGAVAARVDMQKTFVSTLMDTIDKGVGSLVDADMSEESTKLQALQVKQQLGVQALSIANQSSQNILRLFQ